MKSFAIMLRILRQFRRDKRTLALIFLAPLVVLSLMYLVFNGDAYEPALGVIDIPEQIEARLEEHGASVFHYTGEVDAEQALDAQTIDAYLMPGAQAMKLRLEGSEPSVNKAVLLLMSDLADQQGANPSKPDISYLHGSSDMSTIDQLGPILIGFFVFFFVFLIAGVSFLRERTTGTLERLLSTPLKRSELVAGYIGGFGIFTMVQALLISWFCIQILGIMMDGAFGYVLLVTLLLSLTALTLGTLLSAFANNELQMIQFIPLIIVPQLFLSGLFPLDTLPGWLVSLKYMMPLAYGTEALSDIMIRGKGWDSIAINVVVLLAFSALFSLLNVIALRKHRKI